MNISISKLLTLGAQALLTNTLMAENNHTPPAPPDVEEQRLNLEFSGVRMPAIIALPKGGPPDSAIVLIPGSLWVDVDGNMPSFGIFPHVYADLARQLAHRGHAVIRFAKTGPQTGSQVFDKEAAAAHGKFSTRVKVAHAAFDLLKRELALRNARVRHWVVAGHSEGAVVATLLCLEQPEIDGLITLSGPSVGIFGIMREQLPPSITKGGTDYSDFDTTITALRHGFPLPSDAAKRPQLAGMAMIDKAGINYLVEVDLINPAQAIARVTQPVLIVQGENDSSVPPHHAQTLLKARGGKKTELKLFPNLQHCYKHVPPGTDPMTAFGIATESDPEVSSAIDGWLRTLRGK
jgi:pimeloyl-ACP methyl ester carboxylesterase